jgi:hypothetical protein
MQSDRNIDFYSENFGNHTGGFCSLIHAHSESNINELFNSASLITSLGSYTCHRVFSIVFFSLPHSSLSESRRLPILLLAQGFRLKTLQPRSFPAAAIRYLTFLIRALVDQLRTEQPKVAVLRSERFKPVTLLATVTPVLIKAFNESIFGVANQFGFCCISVF